MEESTAPRGKYFEDFVLGERVTTGERTISEADVLAFADLTGDHSRLHVDADYARRGPFGRQIAHGLLGLSIVNGLLVGMGFLEGTLIAFREFACKFSRPIYLGDTIHAVATVVELKAIPRLKGGAISFTIEVIDQEGRCLQTGRWMVLVSSREDQQV
jgi:acyl dehydratase